MAGLVALGVTLSGCGGPSPGPLVTVPAEEGWQYRWHPLPCSALAAAPGRGAVAAQPSSSALRELDDSPAPGATAPGPWSAYGGRGQPPGRAAARSLRLRARVPPMTHGEPHVAVLPLGRVGHAAVAGRPLVLPPGASAGQPVGVIEHVAPAVLLLALPEAAAGQQITLCLVAGPSPGLGFARPPRFGSALALLRTLVLWDLPYLTFWAFVFVLGLTLLAAVAVRPRAGWRLFLALGLFLGAGGLWQLLTMSTLRVNSPLPLPLDIVRAAAYGLAPASISLFLWWVLSPRWRSVLRWNALLLGAYALVLVPLTVLGLSVVDLPWAYRGFHVALALSMVAHLYVLVREAAAGEGRARILLPGMIVASSIGALDLAARGLHLLELQLDLSPVAWAALLVSFLLVAERHLTGLARDKDEYARQLAVERDRAEQTSLAKSELLATLSHEVRTPMNSVLGLTQLLLGTALQPRQREYATLSAEAARALLRTLDEVLDFSRVEAGRIDLQSEPFDLRAMVDSLARTAELLAGRKGVGLRYTASLGTPHAVRGDALRLRQVLGNLLDNAVKFTERGHVQLSVDAPPPGGADPAYVFRVSDTGLGISEAKQRALFESYVRGAGAAARKGGSGLGLPIAKRLVELMGGRLQVETWEGDGSAFTVRLPLLACPAAELLSADEPAPATQPPARALAAAPAELEASPPPSSGASDASRRVLLAEDDPMSQRLMMHLFEQLGVEYDLAAGGREALARLSEGRYALVLMDCFLPGVDGLEATRQVRAGAAGDSRVPIVALTASAGEDERARCAAAGMDLFLSKPLEFDELRAVLRRYSVLPSPARPAASGAVPTP